MLAYVFPAGTVLLKQKLTVLNASKLRNSQHQLEFATVRDHAELQRPKKVSEKLLN